MMRITCSTCGVGVQGQEDFVRFNCPDCGETTIVRCKRCKVNSVGYKCEKCGFEGP